MKINGKYIKFIIVLLSILLIIGYSICKINENKPVNLINVSSEKLFVMLDEEKTFFLYIGRPSCPDCEEYKPILEDVVLNKFEVFYYNTDETREDKEYEDLLERLGVDAVPMLIQIKNGAAKNIMYFTKDKKKIKNFLYEI